METRLSKHEEGRGGGKGENTTEGATMAASWQDEELKKKKKEAKNVPVTIGHSCTLQMQKSMADSPREHNLSTGGAQTSQQVPSLPLHSKSRKKKKNLYITSFVAMIGLTSKYNTFQANSRNLLTGGQKSYLK